jgi:hypothetical protein
MSEIFVQKNSTTFVVLFISEVLYEGNDLRVKYFTEIVFPEEGGIFDKHRIVLIELPFFLFMPGAPPLR